MARKRYISTDVSTDKQLNRMGAKYGDGAQLFYLMMIPHADDNGTITGDPWELLGLVWGSRRDKTEDDVTQALDALAEFRLIIRGEDGLLYFPCHAFYKYQSYIKQENRRNVDPEPLIDDRRKTPENAGNNNSPAIPAENAGNLDSPVTSPENTVPFPFSFSFPVPGFSKALLPNGRKPLPPDASDDAPPVEVVLPVAADEPSPTNQDVIRELVSAYRDVIPEIQHRKSDWSYLGRVYNACGTEATFAGIQALGEALAQGEIVAKPLPYVGAVARNLAQKPLDAANRTRGRPTVADQNKALIHELWREANLDDT